MKILYTQIGNILHNLRHLTTSYKYFRRKQIMKNYNQSNQNTNTGVNNTMLNSNNSFAERFKNKGELAELMFLYLHGQNTIIVTKDWFSRKTDTDFLVIGEYYKGGLDYRKTTRCEVKQDNQCWKYGNLFLEYKTVRKGTRKLETEKEEEEDGWMIISRADELWYFDTMNKLFYVFDFQKLRNFFSEHFNELPEPRKPFYDSEDDADKYGKLYKIEEDRANALKMIVFIDDVDGLDEECDRYLKLLDDKADKKEIEEFIYYTAQFVDFLISLNGGEPLEYNNCLGIPDLDSYVAKHRDLDFVKKYVNTMIRECVNEDGVRAFAKAKTLL